MKIVKGRVKDATTKIPSNRQPCHTKQFSLKDGFLSTILTNTDRCYQKKANIRGAIQSACCWSAFSLSFKNLSDLPFHIAFLQCIEPSPDPHQEINHHHFLALTGWSWCWHTKHM